MFGDDGREIAAIVKVAGIADIKEKHGRNQRMRRNRRNCRYCRNVKTRAIADSAEIAERIFEFGHWRQLKQIFDTADLSVFSSLLASLRHWRFAELAQLPNSCLKAFAQALQVFPQFAFVRLHCASGIIVGFAPWRLRPRLQALHPHNLGHSE